MKKILFTVFAVCFAGATTFAQMTGGLKAGVNLATQKWEVGSESDSENGTSFHIGGYLNFPLSDALSLQPEVLYNSIKIAAGGDDLTMNYISIPVMFMYGFSDNKFNVQAGPQIGLLMSTDPSEVKDAEVYKGTDFTLNLGAGANFGKFNITARYGLGLANINDKWGALIGVDDDDLTIKNNNIQISVGYTLFGGE